MPSLLENLASTLVADLDDGAKQTLLEETTGVNALGILLRMGNYKEEVRNPSAFVAKAVRTAASYGPGGKRELDACLEHFEHIAFLDERAMDMLRRYDPAAAGAAVSTLLAKDAGSMRNASAFIVKVLNDGAYEGQSGGESFGMAPAVARWSSFLDPKALEGLASLPLSAQQEVIEGLEFKGAAVRNPSAYVTRACARRGWHDEAGRDAAAGDAPPRKVPERVPARIFLPSGPPQPEMVPERPAERVAERVPPRQGDVARVPPRFAEPAAAPEAPEEAEDDAELDMAEAGVTEADIAEAKALLGRLRGFLDEDAQEAIRSILPQDAIQVMTKLEELGASVQNPSAYVCRAVRNLASAAGMSPFAEPRDPPYAEPPREPPALAAAVAAPARGPAGGPGPAPQLVPTRIPPRTQAQRSPAELGVDEAAQGLLADMPDQTRNRILDELRSKAHEIRNPSAYVVRAAQNIGMISRPGEWDAGREIPDQHGSWGGAASAAAAGGGAGAAPAARADAGLTGMEHLTEGLDDSAKDALASLTTEERAQILHILEMKGYEVQNPSAFVFKAVTNAKRERASQASVSKGPPAAFAAAPQKIAPRVAVGAAAAPGAGQPQLDVRALVAPWQSVLDEKSQSMLESLSAQEAEEILQRLENNSESINNPSAWVVTAVQNLLGHREPPLQFPPAIAAQQMHFPPAVAAEAGGRLPVRVPALLVKPGPGEANVSAKLEIQAELRKLEAAQGSLDDKALEALSEVGLEAAMGILRRVNEAAGATGVVTNLNAYIIRACLKELNGAEVKRARYA